MPKTVNGHWKHVSKQFSFSFAMFQIGRAKMNFSIHLTCFAVIYNCRYVFDTVLILEGPVEITKKEKQYLVNILEFKDIQYKILILECMLWHKTPLKRV